MKFLSNVHYIGNTIGVIAISIILLIAFKIQLIDGPNPCPLCYLQRIAYISAGFALCLNLAKGTSMSYYALFILSCLFGLITAIRQSLLHILPKDHGYGGVMMGMHIYSWNVIIFIILIVIACLALLMSNYADRRKHIYTGLSKALISIMVVITLLNLISSLLVIGD